MDDRAFCAWVRLRSEATQGSQLHQRLIEATDRLAMAATKIEQLEGTIRYTLDVLKKEFPDPLPPDFFCKGDPPAQPQEIIRRLEEVLINEGDRTTTKGG